MKKELLIFLILLPFVLGDIGSFFGPNSPPDAPGVLCTPLGCDIIGNVDFQNHTLYNAVLYDSIMYNSLIVNTTYRYVNATEVSNPFWVNITGDTMTGNLSIRVTPGDVQLLLDSETNSDACLILQETDTLGFNFCYDGSGTNRWVVRNNDGDILFEIGRDNGRVRIYNNLIVDDNVTADYFYGSGAFLSELNVSGNVSVGGDINALGYTISANYLRGIVGLLEMRGDPWWLAGTDLQIDQDLIVDGEISGGYIDKYTTGNFEGSLYTQKTDSSLSNSNSLFQVISDTRGTPQFQIQDGGPSQASFIARSFMIVNQNNTLLNLSQNNLCSSWGFSYIDCNTATTGADFGVTDDIEAKGIIYADEGLRAYSSEHGAYLVAETNGGKISNGTTGFYTTLTGFFCDVSANFTLGGWIIIVDEASDYNQAYGDINVIVNSTCVELKNNPSWNDNFGPVIWIEKTSPNMILQTGGFFEYYVGNYEQSQFKIKTKNGVGFTGFYVDDKAGANQHEGFRLDQNINNNSGIIGQNIFSFTSIPTINNDYHTMLLEMDTTNINDSGLTFIGAVHFGENINNEIDFIHLIGDFDNIIKSGIGDILDRAYYDDTTTTVDVTTAFDNTGINVPIFEADDSIIYIGSSVNFTTVGISLSIVSSSNIVGIYYYCNNIGNWVILPGVTDTTNGMKTSGTLHFINPTDRGICNTEIDLTPFADTNEYAYIAIQRTRNNIVVPPTEGLIEVSGGGMLMLLQDDYMKLNPVDTAPTVCSATSLGGIYYDISEDNMCVCKTTGWKVIQDGSECT